MIDFPMYVLSKKIFVFDTACQILGRDMWKVWAKKEKYSIFPGLLKGIRPKFPELFGTLHYIFLV